MSEEIIPSSKLKDITTLLKNYEIKIYTNKNQDFDWLQDGHYSIKIINREIEMFVDLEDEMTLFFGDWHGHYYPDEKCYETMKNDIIELLNNKKFAFNIYSNNKWFGSKLKKEKINTKEEAIKEVQSFFSNHEEFIEKLNANGLTVKCNYWNSQNNKEFKIEKNLLK